jgi:hypothetical protein
LECWVGVWDRSSTSYFDSCSDLEHTLCSSAQASCQNICGSCIDEGADLFDCFLEENPEFSHCTLDCVGYFDTNGSNNDGLPTVEGKSSVGNISIAVVMAFTTLIGFFLAV